MNTKPKKYTKPILVKLDTDTRERLDFLGAMQGVTPNEIVRRALAAYLENQ
jgi:predicted DNA-binding protein